uniref:Uncharacterized protein n=1 Tax=Setaria viridis TaxID=4556 RepID=A0A4U6V2D6_SETVI|nr:hypothetical protein SEVIR_4G199600v2 [Setaria viridis]
MVGRSGCPSQALLQRARARASMSPGELIPVATLSGEGRERGSHRGRVNSSRRNRGGVAAALWLVSSDKKLSRPFERWLRCEFYRGGLKAVVGGALCCKFAAVAVGCSSKCTETPPIPKQQSSKTKHQHTETL